MRITGSLASALLLLVADAIQAASTWSFTDASVSVGASKKSDGQTQSFTPESPASTPLILGKGMSLKVQLTTTQGKSPKRPHEAFLLLLEPKSGLEAPFALKIKESGKASLEITQKDIPTQLLQIDQPLSASIVLASIGASSPIYVTVFEVSLDSGADAPWPAVATSSRFEPKVGIENTFPLPDKTPPAVVSLLFLGVVGVTLPALSYAWLNQGANAGDLGKALGAAPISHTTFLGSVVAMEVVFLLYYGGRSLFQTLPLIGAVGSVAFMSGMRALGEVQARRIASGER